MTSPATKTVVCGAAEGASLALQVRKYQVPSRKMRVLELPAEISFVIHYVQPRRKLSPVDG